MPPAPLPPPAAHLGSAPHRHKGPGGEQEDNHGAQQAANEDFRDGNVNLSQQIRGAHAGLGVIQSGATHQPRGLLSAKLPWV